MARMVAPKPARGKREGWDSRYDVRRTALRESVKLDASLFQTESRESHVEPRTSHSLLHSASRAAASAANSTIVHVSARRVGSMAARTRAAAMDSGSHPSS